MSCRFESELSIRQSVEADIVGLRKVIDDTNMGRMNLESEIESLKEELIFLKKNHDNVSSPWANPPFNNQTNIVHNPTPLAPPNKCLPSPLSSQWLN